MGSLETIDINKMFWSKYIKGSPTRPTFRVSHTIEKNDALSIEHKIINDKLSELCNVVP